MLSDIATRAFYPLTLPLTVGPGTISVAITLGANHSHSMRSLLANGTSELIGVMLIAATILVRYRCANRMLRALGATGDERARAPLRLHPALHRRADPVEWHERARRDAAVAKDALTATARFVDAGSLRSIFQS